MRNRIYRFEVEDVARLRQRLSRARRRDRIAQIVSFALVLGGIVGTLIWAGSAIGSPYLVADKGGGGEPEWYEFEGLPLTPTRVPAQADGNLKVDLVNLAPGSYTVRARAGNLWGVSEYSLPFSFTRPQALTKPGPLGITAQ